MSGVRERIEAALRAELGPEHLEVLDESGMHASGQEAESHFKVVVVSAAFEGLSAVERHRRVYGALGDLMSATATPAVHALAITSRTPAEWAASPEANVSPLCTG